MGSVAFAPDCKVVSVVVGSFRLLFLLLHVVSLHGASFHDFFPLALYRPHSEFGLLLSLLMPPLLLPPSLAKMWRCCGEVQRRREFGIGVGYLLRP